MAVLASQVTCPSNAATQVVTPSNANIVGSAGSGVARRTVVLTNLSAQAIYVGGTNAVTTGNGFQIATNQSVTLLLGPGETVWAIGAQFSPVLSVLQTGA